MAEPSKTCSTCGEVKPLTAFSLDKRKRDGRQARCLACHRAYQNRYKLEKPGRYKAMRRREYEKATAAGVWVAYQERNRERIRASAAARRRVVRTPEEQERLRVAHRAAGAAYRERNPELCNRRISAWRQANPEVASHYGHLRRVRIRDRQISERFTRQEIGERDDWTCGICGNVVDPALKWPHYDSQSLDHIVPLSWGGEHTRANARISHLICNVRRGARHETESA